MRSSGFCFPWRRLVLQHVILDSRQRWRCYKLLSLLCIVHLESYIRNLRTRCRGTLITLVGFRLCGGGSRITDQSRTDRLVQRRSLQHRNARQFGPVERTTTKPDLICDRGALSLSHAQRPFRPPRIVRPALPFLSDGPQQSIPVPVRRLNEDGSDFPDLA